MASDIILGFGRTVNTTVTSGASALFSAGEEIIGGILLCNHSATKKLLVRFSNDFTNVPSITTTLYHISLPPETMVPLNVGKGVAVWVRSEDNTSVAFTGTEFKK